MTQPTELEMALKSLTDIQREASSWDNGALLTLAGPGSGKTRVLTTRIASLIDNSPKEHFRVLALTFTNRAADEMRERIEQMIPDAEDRLFVGTFHAFCTDILRQHGQHLGLKTDFRIYSTDDDRRDIGRRVIRSEEAQGAGLRNEHITRFLNLVSRAKSKLISPDGLVTKFPDWRFAEPLELFYQLYDAELLALNALDFDSLIYKANELFTLFPAIAKLYQRTFRYWCVDEFQDTNNAQYDLLRKIAVDGFTNIFAVADDDQIIYQWNGADYKRLDQFRSDFGANLIQIPTNFRCPSEVVTCANKLITHNLLRSADKEPLLSAREGESEESIIKVLAFSDNEAEAIGIATHIGMHRKDVLAQTAVLARARKLLQPVADALNKIGISAQVVIRRDEFQSTAFAWLHSILRLSAHRTDERLLASVVGTFSQMFEEETTSEDVITHAHAEATDFLAAWLAVTSVTKLSGDAVALLKTATEYIQGNLDYLRFTAVIIKLVEKWQLDEDEAESAEASALSEDIAAWHALSGEITRSLGTTPDLNSFLQELDLRSKEAPAPHDTVPIMTIHGSKGNEFEHIYLIGLVEDQLPSFQSLKKGDKSPSFEEERRNCFVAITRCEQSLILSFAERYFGWKKSPSRFISEMGLSLPDSLTDTE